jgi:hypothetical protein
MHLKTESQREGGNPALANRNLESIQPAEFTPTARQAQHLRRLFSLTSSVAYAVAELAFAGLPR